MIEWLEPVDPQVDHRLDGSRHRSRRALESALANPAGAAWATLADEYEAQARDWAAWTETVPGYEAPLEHAMRGVDLDGVVVEVGAGSRSPALAAEARRWIASDPAWSMIRANRQGLRVQCDVRLLPLGSGSVDVIVGLNAVPFVEEFDRVLRRSGVVVWASTFAEETPIYVDPERLCSLLGAGWRGVAQRVGAGEWCRLSRELEVGG